MQQHINYTIRTMRLSEKTWEDLRLFKFHRKMTWNKLMRYFMEREEEALNQQSHKQQ